MAREGEFTQKVRDEVRARAHYRCVVCRTPFVDVHHIIPLADGGTSDIDNAAPLCQTCHFQLGNNPDLRAQLKGMRDVWYGLCDKAALSVDTTAILERLNRTDVRLDESKALLLKLLDRQREEVANATTPQEVQTSGSALAGTVMTVRTNAYCANCNTLTGIAIGSPNCPTCGGPYTSPPS